MVGLALTLLIASGPRFVIEPLDCAPAWFDRDQLEHLLVADTSSSARAVIALFVPDCRQAPDTLQFTLIRSRSAPEQHEVSLGDLPDELRLRTLALAIAETLVDPNRVELPEARAPVEPISEVAVVAPPLAARPSVSFGAGAEVQVSRSAVLYGAAALLGVRLTPWLELGGRARFGLSAPIGDQKVRFGDGGLVAGIWAVWMAGALELLIGPAGGVGLAWLTAVDADGEAVDALQVAVHLELQAELRIAISPRLRLSVALAGGPVLTGLEATLDGDRIAGFTDYLFSGGVRAVYAP